MSIKIVRDLKGTPCEAIVVADNKKLLRSRINDEYAVLSTDRKKGYDHLIYTFCPEWKGGSYSEYDILQRCYADPLKLADTNGIGSIVFPLISSKRAPFPKNTILSVAQKAIRDHLGSSDSDIDVYICIGDKKSFDFDRSKELKKYIDDAEKISPDVSIKKVSMTDRKSVAKRPFLGARKENTAGFVVESLNYAAAACDQESLSEWLKNQDDTFAVTLLKLIDQKNMTDVECYKKANVSRKTFYKINNEADYRPSKQTVIAFAIALELDLDETAALLRTVGFSLSHSSKFDLIIEYYIKNGIYDIFEINAALYNYDQPTLGC